MFNRKSISSRVSQNTLSSEEGLARRKNTSFKITNILPSRPASNDPDESGEDDPDDSRTEDISDNVDDSVGLVLTARRASITQLGRHNDVAVTATMYPIAEFGFVEGHSGASTPGQGPVHGPRDRFKVVRIETSAPQKRGRWTCFEYADKNSSTNSGVVPLTSNSSEPQVTSEQAPSASAEHDPLQQQQQTHQQVQPQPQQVHQHLPLHPQQPQQQQQQMLSPTIQTASKVPLSLSEEVESLAPVSPVKLIHFSNTKLYQDALYIELD